MIRDDPNPLLLNEAFFLNLSGGKRRMKCKDLNSYDIKKKVNLNFSVHICKFAFQFKLNFTLRLFLVHKQLIKE